jgi:DNA-binding beta-propeller fold protein YncE
MTRRDFLATTGTAAVVLLTDPARAERPLRIGSGEHTYEVHHDWLVPPDTVRYGDTHGLAQDSKGRIYVAHTVHPESQSKNAVCVFDDKGRFVTSWGDRFAGGAHGLDIRKEKNGEFLYHCDTAHRVVVKTDLAGRTVWEKGLPPESNVYKDKMPFTPTNTAFAPNGDFFIADGYGSSFIHQYDLQGNYIRTLGGVGSDTGKLNCPHGLFVDRRGKEPLLAVADRGNRRIQYFNLDGRHVGFVKDGMRQPCHFDTRGDLMLVPDLDSVITLLDKDNKVVAHLGDGSPTDLRGKPRSEYRPGKFIHPHDAIFLKNGDILVAEWVPTGRITLLKRVKG